MSSRSVSTSGTPATSSGGSVFEYEKTRLVTSFLYDRAADSDTARAAEKSSSSSTLMWCTFPLRIDNDVLIDRRDEIDAVSSERVTPSAS